MELAMFITLRVAFAFPAFVVNADLPQADPVGAEYRAGSEIAEDMRTSNAVAEFVDERCECAIRLEPHRLAQHGLKDICLPKES